MKKKSNTGLHVSKYDKPEPPKNEFSLGTARARTQQIVESIVKTYSYGLPRQDELEIIERLYAEKRGIDAQLEAKHQASIIEEYEMNHSLDFEMEQEQYAKELQKEKGLSLQP